MFSVGFFFGGGGGGGGGGGVGSSVLCMGIGSTIERSFIALAQYFSPTACPPLDTSKKLASKCGYQLNFVQTLVS